MECYVKHPRVSTRGIIIICSNMKSPRPSTVADLLDDLSNYRYLMHVYNHIEP